jgi:hypothetical protein
VVRSEEQLGKTMERFSGGTLAALRIHWERMLGYIDSEIEVIRQAMPSAGWQRGIQLPAAPGLQE